MPKTKTIKKVVFYNAPVSVALGQRFCGTLQNLWFASFAFLLCFGKITSYLQRDNLQAPDVLLAVQHVLFTLANLPALYIAFFGVRRLLSYYFYPFGICINKSILPCLISLRRCKGTNLFGNHQTKNQKSLVY